LALFLHNPFPHVLFAFPCVVWLVWKRGIRSELLALASGYLPLSLLLGVGWSYRTTRSCAATTNAWSGSTTRWTMRSCRSSSRERGRKRGRPSGASGESTPGRRRTDRRPLCRRHLMAGKPSGTIRRALGSGASAREAGLGSTPGRIAVIGGGPAGLTAASLASRRGRQVEVLEADPEYVGGLSRTAEYKRPVRDPRNFEDWVSNQLGRRLFGIFFKTCTEKVWGTSCREISADWAASRIKSLSLGVAIRNAILPRRGHGRGEAIKSLIETFRYPRLGPGMLWEECARKTVALGGRSPGVVGPPALPGLPDGNAGAAGRGRRVTAADPGHGTRRPRGAYPDRMPVGQACHAAVGLCTVLAWKGNTHMTPMHPPGSRRRHVRS
jgi:hypothetical protein